MTVDYRPTVFLPQTSFAMKADLPNREPALLERWQAMGLYERLREDAAGRPHFVLHDGPPYANGHIHIGTALNKILKDFMVRGRQMAGFNAHYVPGWDCHGLPIEWKIEEQYRAKKLNKDEVPIVEFRQECRAFAGHWLDVQRAEFKRLGVLGDWDRPYSTMSFEAEAQIARELGRFLMNGSLYRGARPVMWSVVEKTALAEAEIEYHDHVSTTIHVRFPVVRPSDPALDGASAVIWTTTPWTMPGNRAIAYGPDFDYVVIAVETITDHSRARPGERLLLQADRVASVAAETGITGWTVAATLKGAALAGTVTAHPLRGQGYEFDVPLLPGEFVTTDAGTGLVHMAPGHGEDDFLLCRQFGIEAPPTVADDGRYHDAAPLFAGLRVYTPSGKTGDANAAVIAAIDAAGGLLAQGSLTHSYPHSWRSKAPLIFRATPQWFISMAANDLRDKALAAIDETRWFPPQGRNRIRSMVESRPDWCISRQRAWGVPIPLFVEKRTGELLRDPAVIERVAEAFAAEGADAWYGSPPARFLGPDRDPDDWEQVRDIVDVWFDSGSTHSFVLEKRADLGWPAALYLEGSDQHRGWFQSSLLEACGTRGRAPFEAVLTHGFTLDEQGRKMSKSLGNTIAPQDVIDQSGADILRLWVASSDYFDDQRIGKEILKAQVDVYRRFRNTFRYLLGALAGFDPAERLEAVAMPPLERWLLHRLKELDVLVRDRVAAFDFHTIHTELHQFCAVDLSSFYFDLRKDALYCDAALALRRRAVRTLLDRTFDCLATWLAPILCFTCEEAWLGRLGDAPGNSVHRQLFPDLPESWLDPELARRWSRLRAVRRVVTGAIELERAAKRIGSSLQAQVTIHLPEADAALFEGIDAAEICIVSAARLVTSSAPDGAFALADEPGVAVIVTPADGGKCERCWRVLPEVLAAADAVHPGLCERCRDVVADSAAA